MGSNDINLFFQAGPVGLFLPGVLGALWRLGIKDFNDFNDFNDFKDLNAFNVRQKKRPPHCGSLSHYLIPKKD